MMKAKYRDKGTEGGRDSDTQDEAFPLKAKVANRERRLIKIRGGKLNSVLYNKR